ncbi:MAG TPA: hypothetical protein VIF62_14675, partial [Labilithrix sp.]
GFDTMEGWGTSSPITLGFDRGPNADPTLPAIDLEDVANRMQGDEHDLSDDPVYVVNLTTGLPVFLDVGNGYYPVVLRDPWRYFPNDPKAGESNLSFETVEEGAGLPQSAYKPELDTDFDGVLDHPNTMPGKTRAKGAIAGVDDLLTWYERESDTLILRPILPLEEKTEYAVVITDRLRGADRKPVRSPFDAIHHPTQKSGVAKLGDWLSEKRLVSYYGDIAGTGLDHVAFAWTFTTQPTYEDMKILRDGLYGKGPFARFAQQFPPVLHAAEAGGSNTGLPNDPQPPGWQNSSPACQARSKAPFIIKTTDPDVHDAFKNIYQQVFGLDAGDLKATFKAFENIDHVVVGSFQSPYLMGDPASRDPDSQFHVDFKTGNGDVRPDTVQFWLAIPKATEHHKPPFPVAFFGHGVTGHADEVLFYAGDYARQGIALFGYNNPEHGLVVGQGDFSFASGQLSTLCLTPFLYAITCDPSDMNPHKSCGRAHDLNGDGVPDSGWWWWTAHIFHTRDNVRQGILDGMQAVRILRALDGKTLGEDYDLDGKPNIAGDFDLDGIVDAGGPNVPYFAAGESLGGIMSGIQGGIEPYMIAAAPMSGGGSLALDVGFRSYGVVEAVTGQTMGPIVFSVPATERPPSLRSDGTPSNKNAMGSVCAMGQRTVRILVNDGDDDFETEVACLNTTELAENMTVVVSNVTSGEVRCARTGPDGRFRVPIPTSANDKLDIQIYDAAEVVTSYADCHVMKNAPVGRRINTWEQKIFFPLPIADPAITCTEADGCMQFRDNLYPVHSPLVAPNEGFGFRRQSPSLRRFRDLAQAAFDPADGINFAPHYMLKPMLDENDQLVPPHALLNINTVGDNFVEIASGITFARAAGAVPFLPPTALDKYPEYADYVTPEELYAKLGRRTPMQFLIDNYVVEAIPRLGRTHAGPMCQANYQTDGDVCTKKPSIDPVQCAHALYDPDWVSEGRMPYDQPHPDVPLRLARIAGLHAKDSASLAAAWEPRLRGVPFGPDESAWSASQRVVALFDHYLVPQGQHTWDVGDACKKWDFATYGNAATARFFDSQGKDVYYLSHPKTHGCLVDGTCDFLVNP